MKFATTHLQPYRPTIVGGACRMGPAKSVQCLVDRPMAGAAR